MSLSEREERYAALKAVVASSAGLSRGEVESLLRAEYDRRNLTYPDDLLLAEMAQQVVDGRSGPLGMLKAMTLPLRHLWNAASILRESNRFPHEVAPPRGGWGRQPEREYDIDVTAADDDLRPLLAFGEVSENDGATSLPAWFRLVGGIVEVHVGHLAIGTIPEPDDQLQDRIQERGRKGKHLWGEVYVCQHATHASVLIGVGDESV